MVTFSLKKESRITVEMKQPLQLVVLGILESYMSKNEIRTLPNTIHKNKLRID